MVKSPQQIQKRLKIEEQESDPKLESEIQHMLQDIEKKRNSSLSEVRKNDTFSRNGGEK